MKRLINFLILRPALTSKNFTSLGLVAAFFGLYLLAGGKMTWVPKVDQGSNFGAIDLDSALLPQSNAEQQAVPAPVSAPVQAAATAITGDIVPPPAANAGYAAGAGLDSSNSGEAAVPTEENDSLAALRERLKRVDTRKAQPVEPRAE